MTDAPVAIRGERASDRGAIARLTTEAFRTAPHAGGNEAAITDELRNAGALAISLVAEQGEALVGHVAFSEVTINGEACGWLGLGPVSVLPDRQGAGVGAALIEAGLKRLREDGAAGCVVLGDPAYYPRFGFAVQPELVLPGVPEEYFMALAFGGDVPTGEVAYHPAFAD